MIFQPDDTAKKSISPSKTVTKGGNKLQRNHSNDSGEDFRGAAANDKVSDAWYNKELKHSDSNKKKEVKEVKPATDSERKDKASMEAQNAENSKKTDKR